MYEKILTIKNRKKMTRLEKLQKALPQLEVEMKKITNANFKLLAYENINRDGSVRLCIYSEDVAEQLLGLAAPVFKRINFTTWGGLLLEDERVVCFSPKVEYEHWSGGSNGTDYIWATLCFDMESGKWDFENSRLIYKK
jgi:hypothetical protein